MSRRLVCLFILLLTVLALPVQGASTSQLRREKIYADQIERYLVVGNAIRLEARGVKFLAIDTQPDNSPAKGAVILLHGRGVHPAWGFIDKLRMDLAEKKGWRTLSIQLPILEADTPLAAYGPTLPEAYERIAAAMAYLDKQGIKRIVLLGHSSGAITVAGYMSERPRAKVAAVGLIGLSAGLPGQNLLPTLTHLTIPVLDLYGGKDLPQVLKVADARRQAIARGGNRRYRQVREPGANHFFAEHYDQLRARISEWLDSLK